jgi:hypothetical protein
MSKTLADVESMPPCAELAALLGGVDPGSVDDDYDLLEMVAGWDRVIAWAQAGQARAVAEFARRPWALGATPDAARAARGRVGEVTRPFAHDEIAARLCVSPAAAGHRVWLASALAGPLTATGAALASGAIDVQKARVIADGCRHLDPATAAEVESRVLPRASEQTTSRLKQAVRRAVISADPVAAAARGKTAAAERGVWLTPLEDGMAELRACMPAADAMTLHNVVTAAARAAKAAGDQRTMGQLRADMLTAPFAAAVATGELAGAPPMPLATHRGSRAQLHYTVPASVVMGVSSAPGELTGYGPVTADVIREAATDATWRRIITNPVDGTALAVDTATYRPPASLARHIEIRDQTCRFRSCNRPAARCHLDHSQAHPVGRTCHLNLGPECEHHHKFKHALDDELAHLRQPSPGKFVWTMPTGHVYTVTRPAIAPPINDEQPITAERPANADKATPRAVEQRTLDEPDSCPF